MDWSRRIRMIGLVLMSLFIIWHTIAIAIVGPFGQSYLRGNFLTIYQDYLSLFQLNRSWSFYSSPSIGSILSYEVNTATGETLIFPLTNKKQKFDHAYFRYTNFYVYLFHNPVGSKNRGYDKSVARYLCAQHEGIDAAEIRFILQLQKLFTYKDYRNGKRPLDEEFLEKKIFGPYRC